METWHTNDKEWTKQRREQWKGIQIRLKNLNIEKKDIPAVKKYFLSGEIDLDHPIEKMLLGPLLEMWLHPDRSEDHWREIRERYLDDPNKAHRYSRSRGDFARVAFNLRNPDFMGLGEEESFFDGLEERLFHFFQMNQLAEGRKSEISEDQYLLEAKSSLSKARAYSVYLKIPRPNAYLIYRWELPVWHEAMLLACDGDYLGLEWLIRDMSNVLNDPDKYHELVVSMAGKIDEILKDPRLKQGAKKIIQEHREKYGYA